MLKLNIVGAGRVGRTIGLLWHRGGVAEIQDVLCRSVKSATDAIQTIGAGRPVEMWGSVQPADVYLISVPDDSLAATATRLVERADLGDAIVFHVSGACSSKELEVAAKAGASIASVHPIKSFAEPAVAANSFRGTWCGVEGDQQALDWLKPAFESVGATIAEVSTDHKAMYHASVVMASNFMVGLAEVARKMMITAGIDAGQSMQMLAPLMRGTAENLSKMPPSQALTGPLVRGDANTIEKHLEALTRLNDDVAHLYGLHSKLLLSLAEQQGTPAASLENVATVLKKFEVM